MDRQAAAAFAFSTQYEWYLQSHYDRKVQQFKLKFTQTKDEYAD
jgi:hypothetical protein